MYGYIYLTTNLVNGKRYIGQKSSNKFLGEAYLGSGPLLRSAISKYGISNFSIKMIEECDSKEQLNEREKYWISYYNAVEDPMFYNLAKGGEGLRKGSKMSSNTRKKMSKSQLGHEFHGDISKHPLLQRGRVISDITKKRMSENHADFSGSKNPMYGRSAVKGRKWIRKNGKRKYIYQSDIQKYLDDGWELGM